MKSYLLTRPFLFLIACVGFTISSFAQDGGNQSGFYGKRVGPFKSVLVLYRGEEYQQSVVDKIKQDLKEKFARNNATVNLIAYSVVDSATTAKIDSIKNAVQTDLILKLSDAKPIAPSKYTFTPTGNTTAPLTVSSTSFGKGSKALYITAFSAADEERPIWKSTCYNQNDWFGKKNKQGLDCLYVMMVNDGLIK